MEINLHRYFTSFCNFKIVTIFKNKIKKLSTPTIFTFKTPTPNLTKKNVITIIYELEYDKTAL